MKIAIIGGTGLLGSNLLKLYSKFYKVRAFSREQSYNIDIKKNTVIDFRYLEDELDKYFEEWKPDIVINTVAIVNLKKCEDDYDECYKVNVEYSVITSKIAQKYKAYFIQISTDHYYNDIERIHSENSKEILLNNYAKTKYLAEQKVIAKNKRALVVRTNIIGFRRRTAKTFFEWLLYSLQKKEKIALYENFYTSPISVNELGEILVKCYEKNLIGIYNISSREVVSKYDFGIKTAKKFNLSTDNIIKETLKNTVEPKRALALGLDVSKIENDLGIKMPTLKETLEKLYKEYGE